MLQQCAARLWHVGLETHEDGKPHQTVCQVHLFLFLWKQVSIPPKVLQRTQRPGRMSVGLSNGEEQVPGCGPSFARRTYHDGQQLSLPYHLDEHRHCVLLEQIALVTALDRDVDANANQVLSETVQQKQ